MKLEGPVPIRLMKRFAADKHYGATGADGPAIEVAEPNGKKVAIVGSGPAGLTAAWQLARKGYAVTILEKRVHARRLPAARHPGLPAAPGRRGRRHRQPHLDRGGDPLRRRGLRSRVAQGRGYNAVIVATGTQVATRMDVPGEDAEGSVNGLDFLAEVANGADARPHRQAGRRRRRRQRRHGRRPRLAAPGRQPRPGSPTGGREPRCRPTTSRARTPRPRARSSSCSSPRPRSSPGTARSPGVRLQRDAARRAGRVRASQPRTDPRQRVRPRLRPGDLHHRHEPGPKPVRSPRRQASAGSRSTRRRCRPSIPFLFAAGDVTAGATDITRAIGSGRRAAHMVDRWLTDQPLDGFTALDDRLETISADTVLARQTAFGHRHPVSGDVTLITNPRDFTEIEAPLTEEQARSGAGSCLDCGVCSECQECVKSCPAFAIRLDQHDQAARVRGRCGRGLHRPQAVRRRPQARVRLRPVPERDHRHADGPAAGADASVQHRAAARRREGARTDRLHLLHRLARQDRRQPAVLEVLLHVLDQAEPADHGRPAAGRRDHALHGHAGRREAVRRVLPTGPGHGRDLHQGPGLEDHRAGERRPAAALRGHRERRRHRRGLLRPGGARGRHPAQPRRRPACSTGPRSGSTSTTTSPNPARS